MNLSYLFEKEPESWGFRGDPYFWRYLKEKAEDVPMPADESELEEWVKAQHLEVSGMEMTEESIAIVQQFAHGGMSSGGLSGEWWTMYAIPMLKKRLTDSENYQLYLNQTETLNTLLEHHAISNEQYRKSLHDLSVKMGFNYV